MDARVDITVVPDPSAIAEEAAKGIVEAAIEAVAARQRFTIALAGGTTPRETYTRLALPPFVHRMPWQHTWVFFGDERAVGPDHPESNYRMAYETLLSKVMIPPRQVFRMRGEASDSEEAAAEYARQIIEAFGTRRGEIPRFDLVLLGLGIDGHTASLFPGSPVLKEIFRLVAAVHASAATIPTRLTMTLPVLTAADRVLFLVSGAEKAKTVKAALVDHASLPAAMVVPTNGQLQWIIDRPAASLLPRGHGR